MKNLVWIVVIVLAVLLVFGGGMGWKRGFMMPRRWYGRMYDNMYYDPLYLERHPYAYSNPWRRRRFWM